MTGCEPGDAGSVDGSIPRLRAGAEGERDPEADPQDDDRPIRNG